MRTIKGCRGFFFIPFNKSFPQVFDCSIGFGIIDLFQSRSAVSKWMLLRPYSFECGFISAGNEPLMKFYVDPLHRSLFIFSQFISNSNMAMITRNIY